MRDGGEVGSVWSGWVARGDFGARGLIGVLGPRLHAAWATKAG